MRWLDGITDFWARVPVPGMRGVGSAQGKEAPSEPIPKKGNAKECPNDRTIALISHASKVMLKILQARLSLG